MPEMRKPPPATMVNEPQIVLRHQMSHVQCRPLATNTPKDAEAEGDASERNIPLGDSYWSDLLSNAISLSNARASLVPTGCVLRDLHGDTPRSEQEGSIRVRHAVVFEFTLHFR
jgi:hypothetical protein